jgi:spore germination cell wall hydrolase CwlJ-like protein
MSVKRNRPKGARLASFGLGICIFGLMPTTIGYQDIAALLARQPGVAERWQQRMFAAPGTVELATYSFGTPIGAAIPRPARVELASLDNASIGITRALQRNPLSRAPPRYQASDFPTVDRTLKGDRLMAPSAEPSPSAVFAPVKEDSKGDSKDDPPSSNAPLMGAKSAAIAAPVAPAPLDRELEEALRAPPLAQYDFSASLDDKPLDNENADVTTAPRRGALPHDRFAVEPRSLYFGSASLGAAAESIERWQAGAAPLVVLPDPDLKVLASLPPADALAARQDPLAARPEAGESIAPKGEVNADHQRSKTPAERLGLLDDKARAKSEKCLTEAVYFEARGEAVRGQIAVAQVVMNRLFSGFYPTTVCAVVYQNKHGRPFECQFTFACDNIPDVVTEPDMWERATKIAKAMLDGQLWLPEVAKSTHYHAYWVHPSWVAEMKKTYKFGVHTFYRPRAWGDGSEAPSWGSQAKTAAISAQLAEEAKSTAELSDTVVRR